MGNWTLVVRGHGGNQNGLASDADALSAKFVDELEAAGQTVESAVWVYGDQPQAEIAATETENTKIRLREKAPV